MGLNWHSFYIYPCELTAHTDILAAVSHMNLKVSQLTSRFSFLFLQLISWNYDHSLIGTNWWCSIGKWVTQQLEMSVDRQCHYDLVTYFKFSNNCASKTFHLACESKCCLMIVCVCAVRQWRVMMAWMQVQQIDCTPQLLWTQLLTTAILRPCHRISTTPREWLSCL